MLKWFPKYQIATGRGGYCTDFNQKHLEKIAVRLGLRHQKVHCPGSTWFGETELIFKLAKETIWLAAHFYDKEFDAKKYPEIAVYMNKSVDGEWPDWWRRVTVEIFK